MIKPRKTLQNIKAYSIDKYYQNFELKLDSNENVYGPSPRAIAAIKNFPLDRVNYYPAYGELVDKLAFIHGAKPENFVLTNGCDEAINVVLNSYLDEGDVVLSYAPTFSMPKLYSDVIGAEFREIPYKQKWDFDFDFFVSNIKDEVKILYLTSPNNPTGNIIPSCDIKRLASSYKNKLVVLDCTYFNYCELSGSEYFDLVKEFENLVIVRSFSKDYALAGLRIGYIYANEKITSEIKKVISPYSVNAMAAYVGLAALEDREYFEEVKRNITLSREKLTEGLIKLGFKPSCTGANFILCDFGEQADFIYNKLLNSNIKVKYFKGVEGLENTFRITAPKLQDVQKFLDAISSRPLFVFDMDGVLFDVKNSYRMAIKKTYEHFTGKACSDDMIQDVKNLGGMSNDWDVTEFLIKNEGISVDYNEIVVVFQGLFYVKGKGGLIDNEQIVFDEKFFEELTKYGDCAIFTGRPREEAFYSLEKYGIKKYFSYFVCNEDVEGSFKPSPFGLNKIKRCCKFADIFYFGDTVDDIKAGVDAGVKVYGIIPPNAACVDKTEKTLFACGANGVFKDAKAAMFVDLIKESVCK